MVAVSQSRVIGQGAAAVPAGGPQVGSGGAGGPPPVSNTGGILTVGQGVGRIKVDWLTLVFPAAVGTQVRDWVSEVHGEGEDSDRPSGNYPGAVRWATGAVLGYCPDESGPRFKDGTPTCCLILSGSVVDYWTDEGLRQFIKWAASVGARCSRCDLALDVFDRSLLRMEDVHAAAAAGNFSGYKTHSETRQVSQGKLTGDSHTFGMRGKLGSGRSVQFYDKTLESKGRIDAVRMEARFYKEHAHLAFSQLAFGDTLEHFAHQISGILAGSIYLIDRERSDGSRETHCDRCPELPWWLHLKELLLTRMIPIRVERPQTPLQVGLLYLKSTWGMSLALLHSKAEEAGMCGNQVVDGFVRKMLELGDAKLAMKGGPPSSKVLELEFVELLR